MRTTVHLILVCTIAVAISMTSDLPTEEKKERFQLCGRVLVEVLRRVCSNHYISKRHVMMDLLNTEVEDDFLLRSRTVAKKMLGRPKRGVVNECCFKFCTLDELRTYCN